MLTRQPIALGTSTSISKPGSGIAVGAFLAFELVLSAVASWPLARHFVFTAFEDFGGTLNVQRLLDLGLRPGVDFYYPYGLLPLLVARGWFGLFGRTTLAYLGLNILCEAIVGVGLARCARALRLPYSGIVFIALAAPLIVPYAYFNVTHALEMALLVHALAEHAQGRRSLALALVTACAFVKPSMAYVYGFLLLLLILRLQFQKRSTTVSAWADAIGPAIVTGTCVAALLAGTYGLSALTAAQFPVGSRRSYELIGYGFFNGTGRDFWRPPGARLNFYLGTFAGVWLAATWLLIGGSVLALWRVVREKAWLTVSEELGVTTAVLHVTFVCLFFGNSGSWSYYAFALILGTAAILVERRWAGPFFYSLGAMALLVHARMLPDRVKTWRKYSPSAETAGLWATQSQRAEWRHVLDLTRHQNPLIVSPSGCAEMLFSEFHGTDNWWTSIATLPIMPEVERQRIRGRVEAATTIVVAMVSREIVRTPELRNSFSKFSQIWHGDTFDVYRRSQMPAKSFR